jgi:hypothetical protein
MHTVHNVSDYVERERRRPSKTSTNATVVRKAFGEAVTKKMHIPRFIDDYNYHMGGVDIANQYRESYETHRTSWRNWICIFSWIIDQAIINTYRVMYTHQLEQGIKPHKIISAKAWREQLYHHLFSFSNDPSIRNRYARSEKLPSVRTNTNLLHEWIPRQKRTGCIQCRAEMAARKRRRLEEGMEDTEAYPKIERASQTAWGCSLCKVALCRQGRCWELFHSSTTY